MIQIYDWIRYEVNSKGQPAKDDEDLRAGALTYIRLKNHGHATNRGLQKLQRLAKGKTMEVVGIFTQFLQLAANNKAENRGVLREQRDGRPATIAELAEILPATVKQITFAVECLSNPAVSWILADKEGFPENSGDSRKSADALLTQRNTTQHKSSQHNAPEKSEKYSSEFEIFWKKFRGRFDPDHGDYGGYKKVGKFAAWEEWQKLNAEDQAKATAVADKVSGKYVPDAERWLKRRLFDDFRV